MIQLAITLLLSCFLCTPAAAGADRNTTTACADCHRRETPAIYGIWQQSGHAQKGIGCTDCHGNSYPENHPPPGQSRQIVTMTTCGQCHPQAQKKHENSKHGIARLAGRACTRHEEKTPAVRAGCADCHRQGTSVPLLQVECARFLSQSPEMRQQGCMGCHRIADRCDLCHTAHDTDLAPARDAATCGTCHMGPDHPQHEMWQSSRHGVLYAQKGAGYAPDCVTCHMVNGSHDVSSGISMGLAGQPYPPEKRQKERKKMLAVCQRCHSQSLARQSLADGDAIQRQSKKIIARAAALIEELDRQGLLLPAPADRPPHPLFGNRLVIGSQMLYENLSRPETIFFRMKKFYYVTAYKGVYHQNPDYAHWLGNAPLKLAMAELESEAALLRRLKKLEERLDATAARSEKNTQDDAARQLKIELRQLRKKLLQGDLSREEYDRTRQDLLDRQGL